MKNKSEQHRIRFGSNRLRLWGKAAPVFACIAALLLGACSEEKKTKPKVDQPRVAVASTQPVANLIDKEPKTGPTYIYTPVGKRDPFRSFYKVEKSPEKEALGGILTKYEIDQLKLTAIVSGISSPRAQVELPDGKGVIIKVGMRVGKNFGRVVRIKHDEVIVSEDYRDPVGRKVTNYIHMKIKKAIDK